MLVFLTLPVHSGICIVYSYTTSQNSIPSTTASLLLLTLILWPLHNGFVTQTIPWLYPWYLWAVRLSSDSWTFLPWLSPNSKINASDSIDSSIESWFYAVNGQKGKIKNGKIDIGLSHSIHRNFSPHTPANPANVNCMDEAVMPVLATKSPDTPLSCQSVQPLRTHPSKVFV